MSFEAEKTILRKQLVAAAAGSEEQKRIAEIICRLEEMDQKEIKDNASFEEMSARIDQMQSETELRKEEVAHKKKSDVIHWILDAAGVAVGIVGGCILPWKAYKGAMNFEKDGTFTSRSEQKVNGIFRLFKK